MDKISERRVNERIRQCAYYLKAKGFFVEYHEKYLEVILAIGGNEVGKSITINLTYDTINWYKDKDNEELFCNEIIGDVTTSFKLFINRSV